MIFTFALVWTVCAVTDGPGRETLAVFLKKLFAESVPGTRNKKKLVKLERSDYPPDSDSYFNFFLDEEFKWKPW